MLDLYYRHAALRKDRNLPPLPLTATQTQEVIELLERGGEQSPMLLDLLAERVEPGVSASARVKAGWLRDLALGKTQAPDVDPSRAIGMLAMMGGGYNVEALIDLLIVTSTAAEAASALKNITRVYDGFERLARMSQTNTQAREVLASWARAEWFTAMPPLPRELRLTVYKVDGEINTDDFSPGDQAQSRADIPLHATYFGVRRFPDGIATISGFRAAGRQVVFTGDVVGTGSSRKSAVNSLLWHTGQDIAGVPNKRSGGVVLGGAIAPIFYATARDAGILPVEGEVDSLATGDEVALDLAAWRLTDGDGREIPLAPRPATLLDEYRAGGRLSLIIGKQLTRAACDHLGEDFPAIFSEVKNPTPKVNQGYTLAQKMVGRACGRTGILPGTVCEPRMTTVGSQDTTGPMTIQEIAELGCLRFKAGLYMQSFCHTAAYPKASDLTRWQEMATVTVDCGGVALQPGDGVIHPWLNTMLVPDTVGTGGDSHTRFPLGISFPAGSGLVAFAGALGFMPMEMPPSVLVRFRGKRRPGITVRDMVNAIPLEAIRQGLLTVPKKNKKNIFAGAILEIEGVEDLCVEEAFELTDASAERSGAACTVKLPLATVVGKVKDNCRVLQALIDQGYQDQETLAKRIAELKVWLEKPELLERDENAEYIATLDIDLAGITEPILACPNDPDDVRPLSEVAGEKIDEAFIGSCMTHLSHLQSAARLFAGEEYATARLWLAPATRLDRDAIQHDGGLAVFAKVGGRVEIPGCSLCMGNQARVKPGSTVLSTSTRNFDNRLGDNTRVYLGSTELTAISALQGVLPSAADYFAFWQRKQ